MTRMGTRAFWLQRGVIPRWEYMLIFLAILAVGFYGYRTLQGQSDALKRQADANSRLNRQQARLIRQQAQTAKALKAEVRARLDQNCALFERNWAADITSLGSTYKYVADLTTRQTRDPLSVAVIRTVPRQEKTVQANRPPAYCKGDVGLKDSEIPKIPKRPPRVQALLKR